MHYSSGGNVDDDEMLELLLREGGPESLQDKWLTDEEHGSGKWWRFAIERLLPIIIATRFVTQMLEFVARSGPIMYNPVWVSVVKMVNANPRADEEDAIMLVQDEVGHLFTLQGGRPMTKQGLDPIPAWLAGEETVFSNGKKAYGTARFNRILRDLKSIVFFPFTGLLHLIFHFTNLAQREVLKEDDANKGVKVTKELFFGSQKLSVNFVTATAPDGSTETRVYIDPKHLQRVRMWVPTPISEDFFQQSVRLPFEMVPNWDLDENIQPELALRGLLWYQSSYRNAAVLTGEAYTELANEFVPWNYCGVPGLDEELYRARTLHTEPRVSKLPLELRRLAQAGVVLWQRDGEKEFKVPRWLENTANMTIRVHHKIAHKYVTAEQVYKGMGLTKDKVGYDPYPVELFTEIQQTIFGLVGNWTTLSFVQKEKVAKDYLTALVKFDPTKAAEWQGKIRGNIEDWIDDNYDLKPPSLQYEYRKWFYDLYKIHDGSWAAKADRWSNILKLRVHVIKLPRVVSSTSQSADLSVMELFMADFESWRNIEHMQAHWQSVKTQQNEAASMDPGSGAAANLMQRDLGGIWQPRKVRRIWRWRVMDREAPKPLPGDTREVAARKMAKRLEVFGYAWVDKEPWEEVDHDGVQARRFILKKFGWVKMMAQVIKGLSSDAGTAAFPTRPDLEKLIKDQRNYENEYQALLHDDYYGYDPVDCVKHMKGLVIFSVMDDVNDRLKGRFPMYPGFRLSWDNCYQVQTLMKRMWKILPPGPRVDMTNGKIGSWIEEGMEHIRPEINKLLQGVYRSHGRYGLNKYFTGYYQYRFARGTRQPRSEDVARWPYRREIQDGEIWLINRVQRLDRKWFEKKASDRSKSGWVWVPGWYEQSDERLHEFMYWHDQAMSTIEYPSGAQAWDIKMSVKTNHEGYGEGYGSIEEQQDRRERNLEKGLMADYYTEMKRIISWFGVRLTSVEFWPGIDDEGLKPNKTWVTLNEVKMECASAIKSGKLLYFMVRDDLWPRLQEMAPTLLDQAFPEPPPQADQVERDYVTQRMHLLIGVDPRPSYDEALEDPVAAEWLDEVNLENQARYARLVTGRFMEINERHAA